MTIKSKKKPSGFFFFWFPSLSIHYTNYKSEVIFL
nr:MAG TPA: hypothetical protein [Caudoviricetes sp.]